MATTRRKRRAASKPVVVPATVTVIKNDDPDKIIGKPKMSIIKADNRIKVTVEKEEAE